MKYHVMINNIFKSIIKDKYISPKNYKYNLTEFKTLYFGKPRKTRSWFSEGRRLREPGRKEAVHRTLQGGT